VGSYSLVDEAVDENRILKYREKGFRVVAEVMPYVPARSKRIG
jgi:hypothetical protein